MYCLKCGAQTICFDIGGCGGRGGLYGCIKCDAVFEQTDGGMFSGGNAFEYYEDYTFKEMRHRQALKLQPFKLHECHVHCGEWCWTEIAPDHETHYFQTQQEANDWLVVYVKKLYDELSYPNCDKCGKKSIRRGSIYKCNDCKRIILKHAKDWIDCNV